MNCDKCPHMKAITAALRPCQVCDAGRLAHTSSIDASQKAEYALAHKITNDHTPSVGVTNLAPEDEDKLRRAMSNLFGLDPIDLLLVQHIFAGKSLATFGDTLLAVERKVKHYHGTIRSMAHAKKNAILAIFPQIEPIFKHLIDENNMPSSNPDDIKGLI